MFFTRRKAMMDKDGTITSKLKVTPRKKKKGNLVNAMNTRKKQLKELGY